MHFHYIIFTLPISLTLWIKTKLLDKLYQIYTRCLSYNLHPPPQKASRCTLHFLSIQKLNKNELSPLLVNKIAWLVISMYYPHTIPLLRCNLQFWQGNYKLLSFQHNWQLRHSDGNDLLLKVTLDLHMWSNSSLASTIKVMLIHKSAHNLHC